MSKINFVRNKVYNYVKGRNIAEIILDGMCVALAGLFLVGFTIMNYHIWIGGNIPHFGF